MGKIFNLLLLSIFLFKITIPQAHSLGKPKDSSAYSKSLIQVDDLLMKVEVVSTTLDSINKITKNGFDTHEIEEDLPDIQNNLKTINDNLVLYSKVLNVKNLQMFQVLLEDIKNDLDGWRTSLFKYNKELGRMKLEMDNFAHDSTARIIAEDTVFRHLYFNELQDIKEKWVQAKHFTTSNLLRITRLQAKVSKAYFQTIELQETVTDKLREFRRRNWGKEFDPLYVIHPEKHKDSVSHKIVHKAYHGQRLILEYYIQRNWYNQLFIVLLAAAYFYWIYSNKRVIRRQGQGDQITDEKFKYTGSHPVLSTMVVVLNIAPFFDINPPSAYVELMQLLLLIALTVLFAGNWPKRLFYYWLIIILLYVLFAITYAIITPDITIRSILLILNIASIVFGMVFTWKLKRELALPPFVKMVFVIYIILNLLAALSNFYGRVSLAKVVSMASIFGLTQIIGLSIFIQVITETFLLQMLRSKTGGGIITRLNYEKILKGLGKFLSVVAVVLWFIIFTSNLGMYSPLYTAIDFILTKERKFGSINFSFGNVLLFFSILYISHLVQKYIAYFFGASDEEFIPDKKGTRLVILRLLLLILGFFLAVTASGLPIDRITLVLGALGVGIGLGLQNIVNNLVSGVILIFESPFQIGDSIEVGNKKGRVKDMGIRSSRLVSSEGSEIIVPNGDLLSGQVINWSVNKDVVRSEIIVKIDPDSFPIVKEYVLTLISNNQNIVKRMKPEVFINSIGNNVVEVKIWFWITNIRKEPEIKTDLLINLYKGLKDKNIKWS
jgi:small-conductance mechanosensitive channel